MKLFGGRKKKEEGENQTGLGETTGEGMVWLYNTKVAEIESEFSKFVTEHMERIHEPGGYEREKQEADFMELGMPRKTYLQALDDIECEVEQAVAVPLIRGRSRGRGQVVTRWMVRGTHNRDLLGIPPSGEQVTIDGITLTTFRDYKIRVEYSYWELPELTRRVLER